MPRQDKNRMTPEIKAQAGQMYADGIGYREIGRRLGFGRESIKYALDEAYRLRRLDRVARNWAAKRAEKPRPQDPHTRDVNTLRADAYARLAEIPRDTRTPAQRLMGDPIFARSALANRPGKNPAQETRG